MSHSARSIRMRLTALAGSLALTLSLTVAPAALAAEGDGPESAVYCLSDALVEKRLEDVGQCFCADMEGEADRFDLGAAFAATMGDDFDLSLFLDAIDFEFDPLEVTVIEQSEDAATLAVNAIMNMSLNPEGARPILRFFLEITGEEVTDDMLDMLMTPAMLEEFEDSIAGEAQDLSTDSLEVNLENGEWCLGSPLEDFGPDGETDSTEEGSEETTGGDSEG